MKATIAFSPFRKEKSVAVPSGFRQIFFKLKGFSKNAKNRKTGNRCLALISRLGTKEEKWEFDLAVAYSVPWHFQLFRKLDKLWLYVFAFQLYGNVVQVNAWVH